MDQASQYSVIGVRGIIGMFFMALEQLSGQLWIDRISNTFESNQDTETYAGIGNVPQLREWVGSKQAKTLNEFSLKITNRDWESTLRVSNKDRRRDKTAQLEARIGELAQRALSHEALLLSALISSGNSTSITIPGSAAATVAAYDGQALYSASHLIGTTALNNDITFSLSAYATAIGANIGVGTTTAPTATAFAGALMAAIAQLYAFQDDQLQPLNEFARKFIVMVPIAFAGVARQAVSTQFLALGLSNPVLSAISPSLGQIEFTVVPNSRLTTTTGFYLFREDGMGFKSLIRQVEALRPYPNDEYGEEDSLPVGYGLVMKALSDGSDYEFNNNASLFSIEKSGFMGIGRFDMTVFQTFVS